MEEIVAGEVYETSKGVVLTCLSMDEEYVTFDMEGSPTILTWGEVEALGLRLKED